MTTTTPRRPAIARPTRWAAGIVMGAVLVGGLPASAQAPTSVAEAQRSLTAARSIRQQAERRLGQLEGERAVLQARLASSSAEVKAIAQQLTAARESMRARAVEAYVSGGDGAQLVALLGADRAEEASARSAILLNQAETAADAADAFQRLKDENDPEVVALATAVDDVERRMDEATSDLLQAAALEADAERGLTAARAAQAASAAAAARAATATTAQPVAKAATKAATKPAPRAAAAPPTVLEPGWAKLVDCESGGDYTIVSATGRYRGAYQFDQRTWESVGGTGDPAAAAPAEQDLRARILYERRGARAWPHCGKYLRGVAPG